LVAECRFHSTGSRSRFAQGGRRWFGADRAYGAGQTQRQCRSSYGTEIIDTPLMGPVVKGAVLHVYNRPLHLQQIPIKSRRKPSLV
jgi:hypothetical protein